MLDRRKTAQVPEILPGLMIGLWLGLPLMMWLMRLLGKRQIHGMFLFAISVLLGYFLFVGCAWAADVVLEQRMNRFDIDGDGGIGGDELTPEAQAAMEDWASDTGRSLAIFTGLPVTMFWAAGCLIPLCAVEWLVRRVMSQRNSKSQPRKGRQKNRGDRNRYSTPSSK